MDLMNTVTSTLSMKPPQVGLYAYYIFSDVVVSDRIQLHYARYNRKGVYRKCL